MKHLIVYYSLTKKTKIAANVIAAELKSDIREISEKKKRNGFLVYFSGGFQAVNEKSSLINDMDFTTTGYDEITLCTPVWGGHQSPAMNSFISRADLKDKKVNLFMTQGGPSPERALENFRRKVESYGGKVNRKIFMSTGLLKKEQIEKFAKELAAKLK